MLPRLVVPCLSLLLVLLWALFDVEVVAGQQAGTAGIVGAADSARATKAAVKAISKGGVAIRALAKTPFGTAVGAVFGAVTRVAR